MYNKIKKSKLYFLMCSIAISSTFTMESSEQRMPSVSKSFARQLISVMNGSVDSDSGLSEKKAELEQKMMDLEGEMKKIVDPVKGNPNFTNRDALSALLGTQKSIQLNLEKAREGFLSYIGRIMDSFNAPPRLLADLNLTQRGGITRLCRVATLEVLSSKFEQFWQSITEFLNDSNTKHFVDFFSTHLIPVFNVQVSKQNFFPSSDSLEQLKERTDALSNSLATWVQTFIGEEDYKDTVKALSDAMKTFDGFEKQRIALEAAVKVESDNNNKLGAQYKQSLDAVLKKRFNIETEMKRITAELEAIEKSIARSGNDSRPMNITQLCDFLMEKIVNLESSYGDQIRALIEKNDTLTSRVAELESKLDAIGSGERTRNREDSVRSGDQCDDVHQDIRNREDSVRSGDQCDDNVHQGDRDIQDDNTKRMRNTRYGSRSGGQHDDVYGGVSTARFARNKKNLSRVSDEYNTLHMQEADTQLNLQNQNRNDYYSNDLGQVYDLIGSTNNRSFESFVKLYDFLLKYEQTNLLELDSPVRDYFHRYAFEKADYYVQVQIFVLALHLLKSPNTLPQIYNSETKYASSFNSREMFDDGISCVVSGVNESLNRFLAKSIIPEGEYSEESRKYEYYGNNEYIEPQNNNDNEYIQPQNNEPQNDEYTKPQNRNKLRGLQQKRIDY